MAAAAVRSTGSVRQELLTPHWKGASVGVVAQQPPVQPELAAAVERLGAAALRAMVTRVVGLEAGSQAAEAAEQPRPQLVELAAALASVRPARVHSFLEVAVAWGAAVAQAAERVLSPVGVSVAMAEVAASAPPRAGAWGAAAGLAEVQEQQSRAAVQEC